MKLRNTEKAVEAKEIVDLYSAVKETVENDSINIFLPPKTERHVVSKLQQLRKESCGSINYFPCIAN